MMLTMEETHSSTEVCRGTGLTYRVLDYWVRTGVITPYQEANGSGSRRRWSDAQFTHLAVMAEVHHYLNTHVSEYVSTDMMHSLAEALREGRVWLLGVRVDEDGNVETGVKI